MTLNLNGSIARGDFSVTVELAVERGETLALVGRNGTGKSTILSCIAGLVALKNGDLSVDEQTFDSPSRQVFVQPEQRNIGMVFQRLHLFPHLSVQKNIEFALKARHIETSAAEQWLEMLHISHLAHRDVLTLSGGEAQRVALARALAPRPHVLLLDEPLSAVDADSREPLRQLLASCLESFDGMTILVSHDAADVSSLSNKVLALNVL